MEYMDLLKKRYSVRAYRPDPVSDEILAEILEAGRLAPSAVNRQPYRIYILPTKGHEEKLADIYPKSWFASAPFVLCVTAVTQEAWTRKDGVSYAPVDAAILMDHMILAATRLGLGTCWVAAFDPEAARRHLHLPDGEEPIIFTPLGYPADRPPEKKRKQISELVVQGWPSD